MKLLQDLWSDARASEPASDGLALLTYRSNLLGADLRITNFGGGNTSSKLEMTDPFTGQPVQVLAVKGSGGDLGSIKASGFALLYMDRLNQLKSIYRGEKYEDEMVGFYPACTFGSNTVPASIDTPLHAFLPFPHVDHLHPDWAIAIAASANGKEKMEEFNARFGHKLAWLPWQRPGFELGLMLARAIEENPGCDGIILGSHGLFTWGWTQRESYLNSVRMIDEMGQFVGDHAARRGAKLFAGAKVQALVNDDALVARTAVLLRGLVGQKRRSIGHFSRDSEVLEFINSTDAAMLAALGTSCPDHFIRTRICPFFVDWTPDASDFDGLRKAAEAGLEKYRESYAAYYQKHKETGSPALRDANPSVILVPGVGMFTFARNKKEARITAEFYVNAIHVMAGATSLGSAANNYVALPPSEAFRIEYWALEEAKIQRMPKEAEYARKIFLIVGAGSGIGRQTAVRLAAEGAHVMCADLNDEWARETETLVTRSCGAEAVGALGIDLRDQASIDAAIEATVLRFGGIDGVINTAAVFIPPDDKGEITEQNWAVTLDVNITSNFRLAEGAKKFFTLQNLPAVIVLTSSANAVVPKKGSEPYDVSKTAVNHLIGELAIGLAPLVRVNGIAPATVVEGSSMFPRERLIPSLTKYNLPWSESDSTEKLRDTLANFYASRTITKATIRPQDCAEAIAWLVSDKSSRTSGHVIPVDGGLPEAFLR